MEFSVKSVFLVLAAGIILFSCSKPAEDAKKEEPASSRGVGPVQSVTIGALDGALASKGEKLFNEKCSACHKIDERYVGPALKGVTTRRAPEWIMNMIINPVEMTQKDPTAKELLAEYMAQMTNQNVGEEEARALLEYFRKVDGAQ
jgi:mono/diheme cytochrome c family protein